METHRTEILPPVLMGWILLHKSGLSPPERAAILGSSGNKLELKEVELALREQWLDGDLREHDKRLRRGMAFSAATKYAHVATTFEDYDEDTGAGVLPDGGLEVIDEQENYLNLNPDEVSDGEEANAIREAQEKLHDAYAAERCNSWTQAQAKAVLADIHKRRRFFPKAAELKPRAARTGRGRRSVLSVAGHTGHETTRRAAERSHMPRTTPSVFGVTHRFQSEAKEQCSIATWRRPPESWCWTAERRQA